MPGSTKIPSSALETPDGGLGENKIHRLVGYQLAQATIVTDEIFERAVGESLGLRPVDYTILSLVKENPGSAPAQLSKALAIARPNMTQRLDSLEQRGWLVRQKNITDRRGQHLRVTKAGAAIVDKATAALSHAEEIAFRALSLAEQMMLTELLHKLACIRESSRRGERGLSESLRIPRD